MKKEVIEDYIRASVTLINLTDDVEERERLFDKLCYILKVEGISDADWYGYEDGVVYNSYINWDANCGFQLVEASDNLEEVIKYVDPEDINDTLQLFEMGSALCDDGYRSEYSTDLIYGRDADTAEWKRYKFNEELDPEDIADMLIALIAGDKGEEEFDADIKKYIEKRKSTNPTKADLYDKMCGILTKYEEFVNGEGEDGDIYERAADMYSMLVEIQNNWETVITKGE